MTSKDYLASISQNPGIRHDEIHTEILLNSSHTKDILLAKHMVEEDLCEKRTIITVVLQNYKEEVLDILGSRKHYHTKASSIDTLLETKVIPELLSKDVFTSTCSAPYEQVFFKGGHVLVHCPGDVVREALVKFFISKVRTLWSLDKGKRKVTVHIEHSDGQCSYHTEQMEKDF